MKTKKHSEYFVRLYIFLLFVWGITNNTATANDKPSVGGPSPEIEQIVKERAMSRFTLSTKGLKPLNLDWYTLDEVKKLTRFEYYDLPVAIGSDHYRYSIWRSVESGAFLIVKYGGIAGIFEVYGVGTSDNVISTQEPIKKKPDIRDLFKPKVEQND